MHYNPLLETNVNPLNHNNHNHCSNNHAKHHFSISRHINQGVNPVPTTGPQQEGAPSAGGPTQKSSSLLSSQPYIRGVRQCALGPSQLPLCPVDVPSHGTKERNGNLVTNWLRERNYWLMKRCYILAWRSQQLEPTPGVKGFLAVEMRQKKGAVTSAR